MSENIHTVFYKHIENNGQSVNLIVLFLKSTIFKPEHDTLACQDGVMNTLVYRQVICKAAMLTLYKLCNAIIKR